MAIHCRAAKNSLRGTTNDHIVSLIIDCTKVLLISDHTFFTLCIRMRRQQDTQTHKCVNLCWALSHEQSQNESQNMSQHEYTAYKTINTKEVNKEQPPARNLRNLLATVRSMDQISLKTPNPKCRLYWCLIQFNKVSHAGIFDSSCELAPF